MVAARNVHLVELVGPNVVEGSVVEVFVTDAFCDVAANEFTHRL